MTLHIVDRVLADWFELNLLKPSKMTIQVAMIERRLSVVIIHSYIISELERLL